MKKFLCLILSLAMLASISVGAGLSVSADSSEDSYTTFSEGDFEYNVYDDGTCAISDYLGTGGEVTIPSVYNGDLDEYDGYIVTGITVAAFQNTAVTIINIPDSITNIGDGAFYNCNNLTEINVDENNTVYSSQDGVLFNKVKTELLKYPQGNERTSYTVPDGVISIADCSEMNYDYSPFALCKNLEIVNIPDSVERIGNHAFFDCNALFEVNIGSGLKSIGEETFDSCDNLSNVTLPEGLTTIGDSAFEGCSALSEIRLPESLETLGRRAFYGCENISEITILENVTDIGNLTFSYCTNLTEINVDENNAAYSSQDGVLFNKDKTTLIKCPEGSSITSYAIPEGVTVIDEQAFLLCNNLEEVEIPNSVQTIKEGAFSETDLTEVVIPASVTSIGTWAFSDCENLKSVTILNPNCDLNCGWEQAEYTFPENVTIYGYAGSTAQEYVEYYSDMGFTFVEIEDSSIIEDTDTEYIKGSSEGAMIHCTYDLSDFVSVAMDGVIVDPENYTLSEGSTILTFKSSYLDTLSVGDHTVTLNYTDKTATSVLTIKATQEEPTVVPDEPTTDNNEQTTSNAETENTTGTNNVAGSAVNSTANTSIKSPDTGASYAGIVAAAGAAVLSGAALIFLKKKK